MLYILTKVAWAQKAKKISSLAPPRSKQWAWQGNPIDVNFLLQKKFGNFWKKVAELIQLNLISKRQRGGKCPPSCPLGLTVLTKELVHMFCNYLMCSRFCSRNLATHNFSSWLSRGKIWTRRNWKGCTILPENDSVSEQQWFKPNLLSPFSTLNPTI